MSLSVREAEISGMARFQALQAGQYWRALDAIAEEGIDAGTVLLIESLRWVDDQPHTIILRAHPSKIGRRVDLKIPQKDGSTRTVHFTYDEHRFLLNDFLAAFEFEPDHQSIRSAEVREVQNRINALQAELVETQVSPALLANVVEDGLRQQAAERARNASQEGKDGDAVDADADQPATTALERVTPVLDSGIVSLATGTIADALGTGITSDTVAAMKVAAKREHQIATIKAQWIQSKTTEIANAIHEMTPYYKEQAAAALAQTEDVRNYVAKLLQGIESLDLYVGKDVEVLTIREGVHAPKDMHLTLVQAKKVAEEELAVWLDLDKWFDFEKLDLFFAALRQHDGLVDQIFPTERCVLVMATTRRQIDYGDPHANLARNAENKKVFLLVRNGMNIHQVCSPVTSHMGAARLFPTKNDQDKIFRGMDGSKIKFEDVAYTDHLTKHETFALHYKRFLLLACGLDHRLKLFGDFYDGPQSLHFVSMGFQDQYCRFLHDDDSSWLLPGEDRPSVEDWIKEKNKHVRSGARVLCKWHSLMNPDTAPGACKPYSRGAGFDRQYEPNSKTGLAIVWKDGKAFCVDVEVTGYPRRGFEPRTFNSKVTLSNYRRNSWGEDDTAFLCLDAVEPEELRWYIHHRGSRSNHLAFIRFFKQALAYVQAERAEEQDTRERMALALAEGHIADPAERGAIIGQAVVAWRAANRGKPLPKFEGRTAPAAWKSLLDQMYMLAGEGKRRVAEVESFVRGSLGLAPLRLVLSGGAKLVVYAAPRPEECDDRLQPHAWVHRITVERGKTKIVEKSRRWVSLPPQAASETTLHEWEGGEEWARRRTVFTSLERKTQILTRAAEFMVDLKPFLSPMDEAEHHTQFTAWSQLRKRLMDRSEYVRNPRLAIPIGVVYYTHSGELNCLCVGSVFAHGLLGRLAPSEQATAQVREAFVKPYQRKWEARSSFDKALGDTDGWVLMEAPLALADNRHGIYVHGDIGIDTQPLECRKPHQPLLADWWDNWKADHKTGARFWLADGVVDVDGRLALDALLGITLPEDYEPVRVREIRLSGEEALPKYHHWLDLCPGAYAPKEERSSFHGFSDPELTLLVESVASGMKRGHSSTHQVYLTRQQARDATVNRNDAQLMGPAGSRVVPATELPDAPPAPEGYERWYVVSE